MHAAYADGAIGIDDSIGDYDKIRRGVMEVDGVRGMGLFVDVASHVAVCEAGQAHIHNREELLAAGLQTNSESA